MPLGSENIDRLRAYNKKQRAEREAEQRARRIAAEKEAEDMAELRRVLGVGEGEILFVCKRGRK